MVRFGFNERKRLKYGFSVYVPVRFDALIKTMFDVIVMEEIFFPNFVSIHPHVRY